MTIYRYVVAESSGRIAALFELKNIKSAILYKQFRENVVFNQRGFKCVSILRRADSIELKFCTDIDINFRIL